jgi:hypothetical protein
LDTLSANWNQVEEQIYSAYELIKALNFQEGSGHTTTARLRTVAGAGRRLGSHDGIENE